MEAVLHELRCCPNGVSCSRPLSAVPSLSTAEGRLDYLKLLVETFEASRLEKGRKCKPKHISRMLNRRNMHGQTALMLACKFG